MTSFKTEKKSSDVFLTRLFRCNGIRYLYIGFAIDEIVDLLYIEKNKNNKITNKKNRICPISSLSSILPKNNVMPTKESETNMKISSNLSRNTVKKEAVKLNVVFLTIHNGRVKSPIFPGVKDPK